MLLFVRPITKLLRVLHINASVTYYEQYHFHSDMPENLYNAKKLLPNVHLLCFGPLLPIQPTCPPISLCNWVKYKRDQGKPVTLVKLTHKAQRCCVRDPLWMWTHEELQSSKKKCGDSWNFLYSHAEISRRFRLASTSAAHRAVDAIVRAAADMALSDVTR